MSIREDREEFVYTGLQGLVQRLMQASEEAYVRVVDGGWRGEVVVEKPAGNSGPYIHLRRGEPPTLYRNTPDDQSVEEYRLL